MTTQKWGALATLLLAVVSIVPSFIYLVGDLRSAIGPFAYSLADFLYGPVWAVSLVTAVFALRERFGEHTPRRMSLALLAAFLAAGAMVTVACIRSANRQYHLGHPELSLEMSVPVLVVWTTLVAGVNAAGWHFLGWTLLLIGSSGWASRLAPRLLSALYLVVGAASLFVYVLPGIASGAAALGIVICIWQSILLWYATPGEAQTPATSQA